MKRWREAAFLLATTAFLTVTAASPFAADPAMLLQSTRTLFLDKCSRCHEPERAYRAITDRALWARTVAGMAVKDRRWIPPEAVRQILDYSIYYRPRQSSVFHRYCGGCHDWDELRNLRKSEAQWKTCITYMVRRQGGGITSEEVGLLVCGLEEDY